MLVHHGNGFTHSDVYTMPVYLRKLNMQFLIEEAEKRNPKSEEKSTNILGIPDHIIKNPSLQGLYAKK